MSQVRDSRSGGGDKVTHRFGGGDGLLFFLLHPFRRTAAGLGRATEGRVIAARRATVLEFGEVAFGVASDGEG